MACPLVSSLLSQSVVAVDVGLCGIRVARASVCCGGTFFSEQQQKTTRDPQSQNSPRLAPPHHHHHNKVPKPSLFSSQVESPSSMALVLAAPEPLAASCNSEWHYGGTHRRERLHGKAGSLRDQGGAEKTTGSHRNSSRSQSPCTGLLLQVLPAPSYCTERRVYHT